jgi:hypothetical protein
MYKINRSIIFQKLDDQFVCFDTGKSAIYTFNPTAEYVFKKIKSGWAEKNILVAMTKKYDAPLATIKKDIKTIITDMLKHKILIPFPQNKR